MEQIEVTKFIKNFLPEGWRKTHELHHRILVDKTDYMKQKFLIEQDRLKKWVAIYIEKDVWAYGNTPRQAVEVFN